MNGSSAHVFVIVVEKFFLANEAQEAEFQNSKLDFGADTGFFLSQGLAYHAGTGAHLFV